MVRPALPPFVRQPGRYEPGVPWVVAARYTCPVRRIVHSAVQHRLRREQNVPVLLQLGHRAPRVTARRRFETGFSATRFAGRPRSNFGFPRFGCERSDLRVHRSAPHHPADRSARSGLDSCRPPVPTRRRNSSGLDRHAISYDFVRGITFRRPPEAQLAEYPSLSRKRRAVSRVGYHWHCGSRCVHPWAIRKRLRRRELSEGYHPSLE